MIAKAYILIDINKHKVPIQLNINANKYYLMNQILKEDENNMSQVNTNNSSICIHLHRYSFKYKTNLKKK